MYTETYWVENDEQWVDFFTSYRELNEDEVLSIFNEALKGGFKNILRNLPKEAKLDKMIFIKEPHCKLKLNNQNLFELQK